MGLLKVLNGFGRDALKSWPLARKVMRWWRAGHRGYPRWKELLGANVLRTYPARPPVKRVLVATSVGAYLPGAGLESLVAAALAVRGASVDALLCDGALPACSDCLISWYPRLERFVTRGPQADLCSTCFPPAEKMYRALGIPVHRYSTFVSAEDRVEADRLTQSVPIHEIGSFRLGEIVVGEHAVAGALRFYARGDLEGEQYGEEVLRRYFHAALLTAYALRRLLAHMVYDVVVVHHGIYVPMGIIGSAARAVGVRVVNWNPAYRKQSFIFSHGDTYHHTLMNEPTDTWESMQWEPHHEVALLDYLKSRWRGTQDWIVFHDRPEENVGRIARELGVDFGKPCVGLLTNVVWDAQLHYPANAFSGMIDWLIQTIRYFATRPDLQLLIRIHPAEIRGAIPSRQLAAAEIARAFPVLPVNVIVVPPESQVSTYAAMLQCNAVIIYGTKTGVELTSVGKPVIVAGEAWIRNKGITLDASSRDEYFELLDSLPLDSPELPAEVVRRARRYAYHFFFRRMIPVRSVEPTPGWPPFQVRVAGIQSLARGSDPGMDVICDGILSGSPFVYPAERGERRDA